MITYSKKVTLLMVSLALLNAAIAYSQTENNYIFSQVLIVTYLIQMALVLVLGKVKTQVNTSSINNESELEVLTNQVELYKGLANTAYHYAGSYPAWKAQKEFRGIMKEAGVVISDNYLKHPFPHPTKAEQVDFYLSRIIDAFSTEINKGTKIDFVENNMWSAKELPEARGEHLLNKSI